MNASSRLFPAEFKALIPSRDYLVTYLIIYVNVIIFIAMIASGANLFEPNSETLLKWGGNYRRFTLDGQQWRLITSSFIHIGIIHLLLNMSCLLYIGAQVERHLGALRFLTVYLTLALLASITSTAWHDNIVSAGASGAIFGLTGFFLGSLLFKTIEQDDRKSAISNTATFIAINLLYGFFGNVDYAAHVGGLLSGFIMSFLTGTQLIKQEGYRRTLIVPGLLMIVVSGISWMSLTMIPNNIKYYEEKMRLFQIRENQALEIYTRAEDLSKEDLLYEINERGIYYWEENIKLLKDLERISLPEDIEQRNRLLKEYCKRRIFTYQLYSQGVNEETDKYLPEIQKLDKEITDIQKLLE